jgi:release factor glutamine methyltransferase
VLIRELLQSSCLRLEKAGIDSPEVDAVLLLGHCLGESRTALYLMGDEPISEASEIQFQILLQRREQREPLAYILGVQEFWSLDFLVSPDVLIPRPETELLIETAMKAWRDSSQPSGHILDLCCGSGVIAIILAKELGRKVLAIDLSMEAILIARENARIHDVSHLVTFLQSDLLSALAPVPCFSLVVTNPPYVSQQDIAKGLQPEVDRYEPHLALDGGDKGLEIIKRINEELRQVMLPGTELFMEIGTEQGADMLSLFAEEKNLTKSFTELMIKKDYANHNRIFHAKLEV